MSLDLESLTLAEASRRIKSGALSPVELTQACIARIKALDGALNSVVLLTEGRALADAERAATEIALGRWRGPLHGIPYGLKDIIDTAGIRTTCHSRLHLDRVPQADAVVAERLAAAGGVLVAKMATHEFATGGPAFDLPFPPARNPWNKEHFTGGSSSGSGAAVAAALLPLALGTDTGGSIRLPAAYCGIAGIKPTYGLVSRRGVAPLAFSLDHVGPLAWTVEDCALALQVLAGHDPEDPGSAEVALPDYAASIGRDIKGLRIGYVQAWHAPEEGGHPEMIAGIDAAVAELAKLGAAVKPVTLPPLRAFNASLRAISSAEAFAIHAQDLTSRPELYARVTRERLMLGAYVTGPEYVQALRLRRQLTRAVDAVLGEVDVLATAAISGPAPKLLDVETGPWRSSPPITVPFNITGHPALSLCCGYSRDGLPLAVQLAGRAFDEAMLFRVGDAYERATTWRQRRPVVTEAPRAAAQ